MEVNFKQFLKRLFTSLLSLFSIRLPCLSLKSSIHHLLFIHLAIQPHMPKTKIPNNYFNLLCESILTVHVVPWLLHFSLSLELVSPPLQLFLFVTRSHEPSFGKIKKEVCGTGSVHPQDKGGGTPLPVRGQVLFHDEA